MTNLAALADRVRSSDQPLWWAFRFLDEVLALGEQASDADRGFAVDCFLRLGVC